MHSHLLQNNLFLAPSSDRLQRAKTETVQNFIRRSCNGVPTQQGPPSFEQGISFGYELCSLVNRVEKDCELLVSHILDNQVLKQTSNYSPSSSSSPSPLQIQQQLLSPSLASSSIASRAQLIKLQQQQQQQHRIPPPTTSTSSTITHNNQQKKQAPLTLSNEQSRAAAEIASRTMGLMDQEQDDEQELAEANALQEQQALTAIALQKRLAQMKDQYDLQQATSHKTVAKSLVDSSLDNAIRNTSLKSSYSNQIAQEDDVLALKRAFEEYRM